MTPIPRSFQLPGGYRVRVKKHATLASFDAAHHKCFGEPLPAGDKLVEGFWDGDGARNGGVIHLLANQHEIFQWRAFRHEVAHAVIDWLDWVDNKAGVEQILLDQLYPKEEGD